MHQSTRRLRQSKIPISTGRYANNNVFILRTNHPFPCSAANKAGRQLVPITLVPSTQTMNYWQQVKRYLAARRTSLAGSGQWGGEQRPRQVGCVSQQRLAPAVVSGAGSRGDAIHTCSLVQKHQNRDPRATLPGKGKENGKLSSRMLENEKLVSRSFKKRFSMNGLKLSKFTIGLNWPLEIFFGAWFLGAVAP